MVVVAAVDKPKKNHSYILIVLVLPLGLVLRRHILGVGLLCGNVETEAGAAEAGVLLGRHAVALGESGVAMGAVQGAFG